MHILIKEQRSNQHKTQSPSNTTNNQTNLRQKTPKLSWFRRVRTKTNKQTNKQTKKQTVATRDTGSLMQLNSIKTIKPI